MRFPGFVGEWDEQSLGQLAEISSGGTPSRTTPALWNGKIPWITTSLINFNIIKEANEFITEEGVRKSSAKLFPKNTILMAMYGQGKTRGQVAILDIEATTNQACAAIMANSNFVDYSFLFQNLSKRYDEIRELSNQGGQQNLSGGIIKGISILYPSLKEQEKIVSLLSKIDLRIDTQSKIIEELKSLKDSLIRKIFSRKVRFKDADGADFPEWQETSFGNITIFVNNRNKENKRLPVYSINNKIGFVPQSDQFEGIDSNDRGYDIKIYKIIEKATFAYNPARINVGSIGYSGNLNNIIISSLYVCFKTKDFVDDDFLFQYVKMDRFNKQVLENMEGGVRSYLFYENLSRITLELPSLLEQKKIAGLLKTFDSRINLEFRIFQKLNEQKKYFIQNMFI